MSATPINKFLVPLRGSFQNFRLSPLVNFIWESAWRGGGGGGVVFFINMTILYLIGESLFAIIASLAYALILYPRYKKINSEY